MEKQDLETRVQKFNSLQLPGQPMAMHMGTSYLVEDLWKEVQRLRAELQVVSAFEMIKAEQQFTGFDHLYKGGDIVSLVEAMGLHIEEWEQLKVNMPWLSERLVEQVDGHFLGKVNL